MPRPKVVYWYAQNLNERGYGSLFSLDISGFEPGKTVYMPCHVNTVCSRDTTAER